MNTSVTGSVLAWKKGTMDAVPVEYAYGYYCAYSSVRSSHESIAEKCRKCRSGDVCHSDRSLYLSGPSLAYWEPSLACRKSAPACKQCFLPFYPFTFLPLRALFNSWRAVSVWPASKKGELLPAGRSLSLGKCLFVSYLIVLGRRGQLTARRLQPLPSCQTPGHWGHSPCSRSSGEARPCCYPRWRPRGWASTCCAC